MKHSLLTIGLPVVAAGIAVPGEVHAATSDAVGAAMTAYAMTIGGPDAELRAQIKMDHHRDHKGARSRGDCKDCGDCGECTDCSSCDEAGSKTDAGTPSQPSGTTGDCGELEGPNPTNGPVGNGQ